MRIDDTAYYGIHVEIDEETNEIWLTSDLDDERELDHYPTKEGISIFAENCKTMNRS